MIENIFQQVIDNFNFTYILTVNILTYIIIFLIDRLNGKAVVTFWQKRIVLLFSIIVLAVIEYLTHNADIGNLINSAIAAPVAWSWLIKPILGVTPFDYKKVDKYLK